MGLLTPLAIRIGAIPWLPRLLPQLTWVDRRIQLVSRGRMSLLRLAGLPNLMLGVPGRRSGVMRRTPLLYVPEPGDTLLIAGSRFGDPTMPAWVHNLRAAGRAEVRIAGRSSTVSAVELTGADRSRAWSRMIETWPNFARYERRTERQIPVFRLRIG